MGYFRQPLIDFVVHRGNFTGYDEITPPLRILFCIRLRRRLVLKQVDTASYFSLRIFDPNFLNQVRTRSNVVCQRRICFLCLFSEESCRREFKR